MMQRITADTPSDRNPNQQDYRLEPLGLFRPDAFAQDTHRPSRLQELQPDLGLDLRSAVGFRDNTMVPRQQELLLTHPLHHLYSLLRQPDINPYSLQDPHMDYMPQGYLEHQYYADPAERSRKRIHDQLSDTMYFNHNQCFDQVASQNPYLVHKRVIRTIYREFALEDQYHALPAARLDLSRVRRRRKPKECEWKPESVYKLYVECKPDFFEKSDYQDKILRSLCFGKINMRIPRAWSRRPNKVKKPKIEHYLSEPAKHLSQQRGYAGSFDNMPFEMFFDQS